MDLGVPKLQKDKYKFEPGENKVRVLDLSNEWLIAHFTKTGSIECLNDIDGTGDCSLCQPNEKGEKKQRTTKKLGYLYAYDGDKVVMAFIPRTVVTELENFSNSKEYDFSSFPMPYDVTIISNPKAAPKDKYKVLPARENTDIPSGALEELAKRKPLDQIIESIKNKQISAEPIADEPADEDSHGEVREEDIPF
jgi:hypothetical protein